MPSAGRARLLPLLLIPIVGVAIQAARLAQPAPDFAAAVDQIARGALAATSVPSASIAIVRDGAVAYTHAYGNARLHPRPPRRHRCATASARSAAVHGAAILLLQEEGQFSLDDPVGKYVPGLTRGDDVTIRQLLSHTSGYQDYWPQDYVHAGHAEADDAQSLDRWARLPLDFDPGTTWQYSNTNYVIAGLIVEKAAGSRCGSSSTADLQPLGMTSVDEHRRARVCRPPMRRATSATRRPAVAGTEEGRGWLFAAGEIAMTA